jgi:hypothetical protein
MADRYWVGGTGTWNSSSTSVWSSSSGGPSGASVPTSADNVIFDSATTYTVTVSGTVNCLNFTISAGTVTFGAGTNTPVLNISGNFTITSSTVWNMAGTVNLISTASVTITTNNVSINSDLNINGIGGTFTLGSAYTHSNSKNFNLVAGTFDTSTNNYNLTIGSYIFIDTGTDTKVLKLRSSTVTIANARQNADWAVTNFTLDAGTSNVTFTGSDQIGWDGLTWYNVTINAGTGERLTSPTRSTTFNNLTRSSTANSASLTFSGSATINGTLTATSTDGFRRKLIVSNIPGTTRTITVAASSLTNVDFQDITVTGAGAPLTGTRLGDGGNNSGITFSAAKNVYLVSTGSPSFASANWALTSNGTTSANNFPSAHDIINIDNSSAATSGTISTTAAYILGEITFANRTNAVTISVASNTRINKDITLASSVTVSGNIVLSPPVGSTQTIANTSTVAGWSAGAEVNSGGTTRITSNFTMTNTFTLTRGTFDLNNFNLTCPNFASNNSNTRTLAFGTGKIVATGTGIVWNATTSTGMSITGTPVVDVTHNGSTNIFVNAGAATTESNCVSFNFTAGTYTLSLSGNQKDINLTGFSGSLNNNIRTIYGSLTVSSGATLTAGANTQTFAATSGSKTITSNGKTFDFPVTFNGAGGSWIFQDNLTVGSTRTVTHTNGTVDLNGKTFNVGSSYTTATGTKNLTFNGGTLVCDNSGATAFNNAQPTGFTTTAGTGTGKISMTSASAKTFVGGGSAYNCTLSNDGAGALTITGSNTFTTLANGVQPTTFTFTSGTTTTLTNWSISGTAGNLVTIGSDTTAQHTLSKSSGTVSTDYLSISYSNATGGATWIPGVNSIDAGNNSGWFGITAIIGAAALLASSILSPIGTFIGSANANLSSVGSVLFEAQSTQYGRLDITGIGTLSALAFEKKSASADLSSIGSISVIGGRKTSGDSSFNGIGSIESIGVRVQYGLLDVSSSGSISAILGYKRDGISDLQASGSISSIPQYIAGGKFESVFLPFPRDTESDDTRITEAGDTRVTEEASENTGIGSIVSIADKIQFNSELYVKYLTNWDIGTPYVKYNDEWVVPISTYRYMNNAWKRIN